MSARLDPLMDRDGQEQVWAGKLLAALGGAMVMWIYLEPPFVMAGILWREYLRGSASFLALSSLLVAAAPAAAWAAARMFRASNPLEVAKWASWPTAILLAHHWAMAGAFAEEFAAHRDFGFAQFCNLGAWTGAFTGFFAGFVYEPKDRPAGERPPLDERVRSAVAGGSLVGVSWALLGWFLDYSWRQVSGEPDVYLYFTLLLLLGLPFFIAGLAYAFGDRRGDAGALWSVPPTFAALYVVLGASAALVDPSRADALIGRLGSIGLAQGAAGGFLCGFGFRGRA